MGIRVLLLVDKDRGGFLLNALPAVKDMKVYNTAGLFDAKTLFEKNAINILICDLDIPSSEKLISEVRIRSPLCCVIAITEYPSMEKIVGALDVGAWDYIANPISNIEGFKDCVNSAISRIHRWEGGMLFSKTNDVKKVESTKI